MSVAVAAPSSSIYGQVPFLLRALGAIRIKEDGTPFEEDLPKPEETADEQAEDSTPQEIPEYFEPEFREYGIALMDPLPIPTDPEAEADFSAILLPQFTDAQCKEYLDRICTYEGKGAYPWEEINNKILEGSQLHHISDEEFAQWNTFWDYHIDCITEKNGVQDKSATKEDETEAMDEETLAAHDRWGLNDLLWWGIAIDICCGIEDLDAFFEWFGVKEMTLGYYEMGINVLVGAPVEEKSKGGELKKD